MKKERLFYLDFIRAIAVVSILITHFNARFLYLSPPAPEKTVITTTVSNIYIGDWGVSLFFIISGAALMYVYGERCELKKFYKKRALSIYPMFWIAYAACFLYSFYVNKAVPGGGVPKYRIIFSALGFDGLLATNGYATFYLLGEWFLGVIILVYLLFPLIRKLLNEKPILLLVITMVLYVSSLVCCKMLPYALVPATIVFVRLPELIFGMFFVKQRFQMNWKAALAALTVLILNGIVKPDISSSIQTTYVGIASFLVLVYISYFVKWIVAQKICGILSKYSYAIFLVHHIIIAKMMSTFDLTTFSRMHSYVLFITVCTVISFFAWALYRLHSNMMKYCCSVKK